MCAAIQTGLCALAIMTNAQLQSYFAQLYDCTTAYTSCEIMEDLINQVCVVCSTYKIDIAWHKAKHNKGQKLMLKFQTLCAKCKYNVIMM